MKFSVVWQQVAEEQLARLWESSRDRAALTAAADNIERVLQSYPDRAGEERDYGDRVLFEGPLGVVFRPLIEDRMVQVLSVWDTTPR